MKKKWAFGITALVMSLPVLSFGSEVESYVVGGTPVRPGDDLTWMASIRNTTDDTSHFCGGSVVNDRWVLTAAHCVVQGAAGSEYTLPPNNIAVMVGTLSGEVIDPTDLFHVTHVVVHPEYSPNAEINITTDNDGKEIIEVVKTALDNDVALLRVNRDFLPSRVTPINLATSKVADKLEAQLSDEWDERKRPKNVIVSGWGSIKSDGTGVSDSLMSAELSYLPIVECFNLLETGNEAHFIIDSPANTTKVCALPPDVLFDDEGNPLSYGPDSCKGDSGGPLVTKNEEGAWVQLGIVSGGPIGSPVCGAFLRPGFYARVATYYEWIEKKVGSIPDTPVTNPDFIEDANNEGTGGDSDGKTDEECNPGVSGISPNNCALESTSGGGAVNFYVLASLFGLLYFRRRNQ